MVSSQRHGGSAPPGSSPPSGKIFLSYRRDDSAGYAYALSRRLREKFGSESVFMDVDTISPGEDFVVAINSAVGQCVVLLALIGREWLTSTDASGRRLQHDNDFVRLEITAALERNVRVIPVLIEGASMPAEGDLPTSLAPLSRRNAFILSPTAFDADADRFVEKLTPIVPPVASTAAQTTEKMPIPVDAGAKPLRKRYPWLLFASTVAYAAINAALAVSDSDVDTSVAEGALLASVGLITGSLLLLRGIGRAWIVAALGMVLQVGILANVPEDAVRAILYGGLTAIFFGVLAALYWRARR